MGQVTGWGCMGVAKARARAIARANRSIWSLVGGTKESGWAKSPAGDVWVWLRLELGITRATGSI